MLRETSIATTISLDEDFASTCLSPHLGLAKAITINKSAKINEIFFINTFIKSTFNKIGHKAEFVKLFIVFLDNLKETRNNINTTKTNTNNNKLFKFSNIDYGNLFNIVIFSKKPKIKIQNAGNKTFLYCSL